jgi:hypothetical protein
MGWERWGKRREEVRGCPELPTLVFQASTKLEKVQKHRRGRKGRKGRRRRRGRRGRRHRRVPAASGYVLGASLSLLSGSALHSDGEGY